MTGGELINTRPEWKTKSLSKAKRIACILQRIDKSDMSTVKNFHSGDFRL